MKVGMVYGPRNLGVEEIEEPKISSGEVLIRNKAAGVCGSDLHYHRRDSDESIRRPAGGHEFSGVVAAVGRGVKNVKAGDRVGVEPLVGCGECHFCAAGNYHICNDLRHLSGGFGEYTKAPKGKVFKLPDDVSYEDAALLDCIAVGVHAVQQFKTQMTDTAVVLGDAAIGLSTMQVAKVNGARRAGVVGHHDNSLQIAEKIGADFTINGNTEDAAAKVMELTDGLGADVVYESVGGTATTLTEAVNMVRPGGTIVVIGSFAQQPELNFRRLLRYEVKLLFSWSYSRWQGIPEFQIALDLLKEGKVNAKAIITHKFPLDQISDAFHAALNKYESKATKVVVMT
ncbi:alcohol dehydrogenase catalytic domain-containing protein [bacterium]|nr:alcohol dehydrogenase catalytic domain-containing protein [bacterium]